VTDSEQRTQREMRWELESGVVFISFPKHVGVDDIGDLRDLTDLWLRGLQRHIECAQVIDAEWAE
jgi:hypothetical protein